MRRNPQVSEERKEEEDEDEDEEERRWDCGSPLYDAYELVSLSHVIDRHVMALPSLSGSRQEKPIKSQASEFSFRTASNVQAVATSKKCRGKGENVLAFVISLVGRLTAWRRKGKMAGKSHQAMGFKKIEHSIGHPVD